MLPKNLDRFHLAPPLKYLLIGLLVVGIVFRFVNLNHKVYWHDEVYTSLRAAGYTRAEIDRTLFQNQVSDIADLQQFQQLKPGSSAWDTVESLVTEDPQHPPLYFLLARGWMQRLGSYPLAVPRSLPAILSLLALPALYLLAWELFASHAVALMATTLLALSPFDVLFAQTARQYSLLTVWTIVSQWLLLRATRPKSNWQPWMGYAASVGLGLYTHPLFGLTVAGQAVYVTLGVVHRRRNLIAFVSAIGGALLLYAPWILVLTSNVQRASATTDWTRVAQPFDYLLKLWVLSFTALFLDPPDLGFHNPVTYLLRVPIAVLIGMALYTLCRTTERSVWLSVVSSIGVPFLLLAGPDLLMGGKRSAVSRYLIACYPGIQLAVAYFLTSSLTSSRAANLAGLPRRLGQVVFALLISGCLVSLVASAAAFTWWNKDLSYLNFEVSRRINAEPHPVIISDLGNDFTNTGDLISLSYIVKPETKFLLIGDINQISTQISSGLFKQQIKDETAIVFRPSPALHTALSAHGRLQPLFLDAHLWRLDVPQ